MPEAIKINENGHYTYEDYSKWDTDERFEIINGFAHMMSPSPSTEHQQISLRLLLQIAAFFENAECTVFEAPCDVRLDPDGKDDKVVQPDILVVCDPDKIKKNCIDGAPDFIVEILSPSTASHDLSVKLPLYMEAGVKEYWVVDPEEKLVHTFVKKEIGKPEYSVFREDETAESAIFPGLAVDLPKIFAKLPGRTEEKTGEGE